MAHPFQRLIEKIQSFDSRMALDIQSEFASVEPRYRENIRSSLHKQFGSDQVLDLNLRPSTMGWSISVSHCRGAGGWVAVPEPRRVGFDLELRDRIREEAVARVVAPDELKMAPHYSYLWCAKEAFYKALGDEQPGTFSQVRVADWRGLGPGLWSFPKGLLIEEGPLLAAICII